MKIYVSSAKQSILSLILLEDGTEPYLRRISHLNDEP